MDGSRTWMLPPAPAAETHPKQKPQARRHVQMTKTEPGSTPDRATFLRQERPKIIAHGSFLPHQHSFIGRRWAAASRPVLDRHGRSPAAFTDWGLRFAPATSERPQRPLARSDVTQCRVSIEARKMREREVHHSTSNCLLKFVNASTHVQ
jgi:hypothetical protein